MARETKIGMLIGLGVILLIGIIISDHLATVQGTGGESIAAFGQRSDAALGDPQDPDAVRDDARLGAERVAAELNRPIPRPEEIDRGAEPPVGGYDAPPPSDLRVMRSYQAQRSRDAEPSSRFDRRAAPGPRQGVTQNRPARPPLTTTFSRDTRGAVDPAVVDAANDALASDRSDRSAAPEDPGRGETARRSTAGEVIHYLKRGETLYDVAETYLGDGEQWRSIVAANDKVIDDPDRVSAGARLVIPGAPLAEAQNTVDAMRRGDRAGRQRTERVFQRGAEPAASRTTTITAQSGDSLYELAETHLGDGNRWRELYDANRDRLDSPSGLQAGMSIRLPADASRPAAAASSNPPASAPRTYTVRPGDTLAEIARQQLGDGERWRDIYRANADELDSPDAIRAGQTLKLPG